REARTQACHRVEGGECLPVATELDERVTDHAVVPCGRRGEDASPSSELQRGAKAVARERERTEPTRPEQISRRETESAVQYAVGLCVVRGIPGLAGSLLVGQPEQVEATDVGRPRAEPVLQLQDVRGGVVRPRELRSAR